MGRVRCPERAGPANGRPANERVATTCALRVSFYTAAIARERTVASTRLIHDAAFEAATTLTEIAEPKLAPDERKVFHRQAYQVVKAAIEAFDVRSNREAERLCPGRGLERRFQSVS